MIAFASAIRIKVQHPRSLFPYTARATLNLYNPNFTRVIATEAFQAIMNGEIIEMGQE